MIGELQLPPASVSIPGIIDNDDGSELTHRTITDADRGDGGGCSDGIRHNNNSNRSNHRELIQLKQQLSKQQNQIDILSKRLNACEIERDVLVEEKKVLLVELTATNNLDHSVSSRDGWGGMSRSSLQMSSYTDMQYNPSYNNQDNETNLRVMRKSFQNYIKDSRRNSYADKQKICVLQREVETLKQRLVSATNNNGGHGNKHMSASDRTATTYPTALDLSSSLRNADTTLSSSHRSSLNRDSHRDSSHVGGGGDGGSCSLRSSCNNAMLLTTTTTTSNTNANTSSTNNNNAMLRNSLTLRDIQPHHCQPQQPNNNKPEQQSSIDSMTMMLRRNSIASTSISGNACSFMMNYSSMPELEFNNFGRNSMQSSGNNNMAASCYNSSSNAINHESMPELDFSATAHCEELVSRTKESQKKEELMKHLAHTTTTTTDTTRDTNTNHHESRNDYYQQRRRTTASSRSYAPVVPNEQLLHRCNNNNYSDTNRPIRREMIIDHHKNQRPMQQQQQQHADDFMEMSAYQRRRTADLLNNSGVRSATSTANSKPNNTKAIQHQEANGESKDVSTRDLATSSSSEARKNINDSTDVDTESKTVDHQSRRSSEDGGSELLVEFGETSNENEEDNANQKEKTATVVPQSQGLGRLRRSTTTAARRWHSVNHVDFSDDSNASSSAKPNNEKAKAKANNKNAIAEEEANKEEAYCSTDPTVNNNTQRRRRIRSTARRCHSHTEGSDNSMDLRGSWTAGWFRRG